MTLRPCIFLTLVCTAISGCAFSTDRFVQDAHFDKSIAVGEEYRHVLYSRGGTESSRQLRVYIDGDGMPWNRGVEPAMDPTPKNPMALRMMAKDRGNVVYIGRPCYFGLAADEGCTPDVWTSGRYSEPVVLSMAKAISKFMAAGGYRGAVLIGFSGGGTLARLLAGLVPGVTGVLTINGNLDIEAWANFHHYLPLVGSVNPAKSVPLPETILHVQAIGEKDIVVLPEITDHYRDSGQRVEVWHYPEFDHVCCWLDAWPDILGRFLSSLVNDDDRIEASRVYD